MKLLYPFIILFFAAGLNYSCTEDFDEINTDPKSLTTDNLDLSSYPLVVAGALYNPLYMGQDNRGAFQLGHSLFADIYANYFATTAPNFDSDKFILVGGWLNGAYNNFYSRSFPSIKYAEDYAVENGLDIENAMMKTWRVFAYHRVTDYWGPIPYSNFGNGEKVVFYDGQEAIYNDFFKTLDEAVAILKSNTGGRSIVGNSDVIYGGDVDQWLRFANSLRLRLAMRVRYADPGLAKTQAEKAIQDGVIESNDQNAYASSSTDWKNNYTTITQWGEFRMSADMESILKGYKDPRVEKYFSPADEPDPTDDPEGLSFPYEGMRNGQAKTDKQSIPFNDIASNMAAPYIEAGGAGPDWPVLRAAEVYFLRAEGALEGWNMGGGSPQEYYNQGITMSMTDHGFDGNNMSGNDYITTPATPASFDGSTEPASNMPVPYNAGADKETQLEQIITQKWISLYPNSWEAYAERRRTGYPTLYPRLNSDNPDISVDEIPRRLPYVSTEYNTNEEAVQDAINNLLGGPDAGTTKLWWDAK
ncbi:SusD/RagB family nutrient-binding outer membrane lipoprotein [Membranicola marinus]|uniref:SusD/RagB family nutrient-binding outer membrane lipoprotein n=1 Tax=Membranihabitans marinus TaxID=1227546 RepID=A0A953HWG3_9BACT|nr:SusD/RagB family nutrient-binding outer membrane lipoprotein [Membranihabitans marinus]MBY5959500.1 SusD/RagB family nutrient-binding outer membrane lipoprotein [Membranihabitans marinus]